MSYNNLKTGNSVVFALHSAAIPGSNTVCAVEGRVNAQIARLISDVAALHNQIKPSVPEGLLPLTIDEYEFVIVSFENGKKMAIGLPWIVESSIALTAVGTYNLKLTMDQETASKLRDMLVKRNITIDVFERV